MADEFFYQNFSDYWICPVFILSILIALIILISENIYWINDNFKYERNLKRIILSLIGLFFELIRNTFWTFLILFWVTLFIYLVGIKIFNAPF